jgi:hypothetical protein
MDLREIGWGGMDWIDLAQDKDQWRALFLSSCTTGSFSRRAQFNGVSFAVVDRLSFAGQLLISAVM